MINPLQFSATAHTSASIRASSPSSPQCRYRCRCCCMLAQRSQGPVAPVSHTHSASSRAVSAGRSPANSAAMCCCSSGLRGKRSMTRSYDGTMCSSCSHPYSTRASLAGCGVTECQLTVRKGHTNRCRPAGINLQRTHLHCSPGRCCSTSSTACMLLDLAAAVTGRSWIAVAGAAPSAAATSASSTPENSSLARQLRWGVSVKLMMSSAASHCRSCCSSLQQRAPAKTAAATAAQELCGACRKGSLL